MGFMDRRKRDTALPDDDQGGAVDDGNNRAGFMRRNPSPQRQDDLNAGGATPEEPDAEDMPNTGRMGEDDGGQRHGFMSNRPQERKKRGFMRDSEVEGHG